MSILFRFLMTLVAAFFRPKMGIDDVSVLRQRVWPIDLDINIHMNNARYLSVMDLGRVDWIIRSGVWKLMRNEGMAPVVGGAMVRYRRSLLPFQNYELRTRLLGWDERWIYVEQAMVRGDGIACVAVQRAGFTKGGRLVTPVELAQKLHYKGPDIPAPEWVANWNQGEAEFVREAERYCSMNR